MTLIDAVNNLYATYGKYGLDKGKLGLLICDGMENYGLSLETCYNGLRMTLGNEYNEQELFSTNEVAEMLDMSNEEVIQEVEKCKTELEAKGEDSAIILCQHKKVLDSCICPTREKGENISVNNT